MKIFVINLQRSVERRKLIEKQLDKQGLEYEIFSAIDGRQMTHEQIDSYMDKVHPYFRELKSGEVGCFLSHYFVLKKITDQKLHAAVVIEDDIILSPNFTYILNEIEHRIQPKDAFMLYATINHPVHLHTIEDINKQYAITTTEDLRSVFGTPAYVVGGEAAANMSGNMLPINDVVDNWHKYVTEGYINALKIIFPFCIMPAPVYSDIHHTEISNERFGRMKEVVRKHKIFPLWQIMMNVRKNRYEKQSVELIRFNGKKVSFKFL